MGCGTKFLLYLLLFFSFTWILLHLIFPLALPFLLGTLLALFSEPLIRFLRRKTGLPRTLCSFFSVGLSFFLFSVLIFSLLTFFYEVLGRLGDLLPLLAETIASGLSLLKAWLLALSQKAPYPLRPVLSRQVQHLFSDSTAFLSQAGKYILSLAGGLLARIPDQALTLFTSVVSGFMISGRLPRLKALLREQLEKKWARRVLSFLRKLKATAGCWLLAQLKLGGVTAFILTLGLILLRIPYAPLLAISIALLDALPLFGTGAVLIPWSLIVFLQGSKMKALGLLALYSAAAFTRSLLEPRFVGRQLGLDPLLTLASMYGGYRLFGIGGMILSPLLAVTAAGFLRSPSDS